MAYQRAINRQAPATPASFVEINNLDGPGSAGVPPALFSCRRDGGAPRAIKLPERLQGAKARRCKDSFALSAGIYAPAAQKVLSKEISAKRRIIATAQNFRLSPEAVSNCLVMPWNSMYDGSMNFKGSLPTLILHNLRQGPNYGYQIAQEIKEKSKGVLDFKEGTLYPALHGLEAKGLIRSYTRTVNGRTRFCYKLTDQGRKVLAKQVQEWDQFTGAISLILKEA